MIWKYAKLIQPDIIDSSEYNRIKRTRLKQSEKVKGNIKSGFYVFFIMTNAIDMNNYGRQNNCFFFQSVILVVIFFYQLLSKLVRYT